MWQQTVLSMRLPWPVSGELHQLQAILEAQSMRDSIMEYTCQAAIYSNRLTRLNNPVVMKKLGDLKRRAEALCVFDEQQCMPAPEHMPKT